MLALAACLMADPATAGNKGEDSRILNTLEQAAEFYSGLSLKGAYVWEYSADLRVRKGEGKVGPTTAWVQPPGTPAVGAAFLRLYEITDKPAWLGAARYAAEALIETQLISGGWYNAIELDPEAQDRWCYRARGITAETCDRIEDNRARNRTLLDDDNTQSALRLLIWLDRIFEGKDGAVRDAALYALKRLSEAQYPVGAWPVMFDKAPKMDEIKPAPAASLPADWSRTWVKPAGGPYYILNDNLMRDMVHLFLVAEQHFAEPKYLERAKRAGEFLLKAQLPEPQQGWAQTYNETMQPVWGRKFEPPSVASRETAGAITCLIELYGRTGDKRFLDAAKKAGAWLEKVRLPDGDWARFYELATNRPIYVGNDEKLTYEPVDLLSHYGMKIRKGIPEALALLAQAEKGENPPKPLWPSIADTMPEAEVKQRTATLLATIDSEGRWLEDGEGQEDAWIRSATFIDAVFVMAKELENKRQRR
ncbi:hypothetical protein [Rhodoligotrophos ferricapiens]|uniref:hypothetical protein n=1 Tax=Rhodoligotrophos ferricapiens TaxID=3069264 RepID=UPI00315CEEE9